MLLCYQDFARKLFGGSSNNKENEIFSNVNNFSNIQTDLLADEDTRMDTDGICTDEGGPRRNSKSVIGHSNSFKSFRADASLFIKETTATTSSFVESVQEWGRARTASFDLRTRPLSFDLGRQSRDPSDDFCDGTRTPTNYGKGSGFFGERNAEISFGGAHDLSSSRKRSQHPCRDGFPNLESPLKRGGKRDKRPSSNYSSVPFTKISRMQEDFHVIDVIGNGNFGSVYRVKRKLDNMIYAIKQSRYQAKNALDRSVLQKEIEVLSLLNTSESMENLSNIVRYYASWIEDDFLYIQMEACEASVDDVFFDVANITTLFQDMLNALEVIHKHDIVHLDVKPGNILLKNNRYKLCDFGMSLRTVNGLYTGDIDEGDSRYMAKELLSWSCSSDLRKCDIFSLGMTGIIKHKTHTLLNFNSTID